MYQKDLIIEYIKQHGSILPAKMGGKIYKDTMFGSETPKRCRELRKVKVLYSEKDGKFKRFFLEEPKPLPSPFKQKPQPIDTKQPSFL